MRLRWSPRALDDLCQLADALQARGASGADRLAARIRAIASLAAERPGIGRVLEQRPDVRVLPLGTHPYLLFYTQVGDEVVILHVRHTARSPIAIEQL